MFEIFPTMMKNKLVHCNRCFYSDVFKLYHRKRDLPEIPPEEQERRALLLKRWSKFKFAQHVTETRLIEGAIKAQEKALNELRTESEELYQQAIKTDNSLFPLEGVGPTHTPAIDGFDKKVIDGEYVDVTRQYR